MPILTINSGSSSIKFSLYEMNGAEGLLVRGVLEGIGSVQGAFVVRAADALLLEETRHLPDHKTAIHVLFDWLRQNHPGMVLDAVGHRIVHGGTHFFQPRCITPELPAALRELIPLAPEHLPHEIQAVEEVGRTFPDVPQVACFDTAFHSRMPETAQRFALPGEFFVKGVRRYGFHGLSYEYVLEELGQENGPEIAGERLIIAHLGHGCSMAAVREGRCADTTMGFTPTGGLVMSTRSGDLDPGVILYLMEARGMSPNDLRELLNRKSGLLGVSGISRDMKKLLEMEKEDPRAAQAIELFCYQAKKFLGALTAALGGLNTLVFTGGIGENAPEIRRKICHEMDFLGIRLNAESNRLNRARISRPDSAVMVRVMKTNEELMIARHTYRTVLGKTAYNGKKS